MSENVTKFGMTKPWFRQSVRDRIGLGIVQHIPTGPFMLTHAGAALLTSN